MADLCTHLRDSEDHRYELLLGVSGVGPVKVENYGAGVLGVLEQFR